MFEEWRKIVNATLDKLVLEDFSPYASLFSAARYSLLGSGKRIRPLFTFACLQLWDCDIEKGVVPACALEMVHTYSLIHDDLPCMDDDDWRRGKPTLHKVYPESHALLTGDFLLTFAFETLSSAPFLSSSERLALIHSLAKHAGAHGIIGGQVMDLARKEGTLEETHRKKTGVLFQAALEFAGIIAKCTKKEFSLLSDLGNQIGYLFQVADDIADQENEWTSQQVNAINASIQRMLEKLSGNKKNLELLCKKILEPILVAPNA